MPGILLFLLFGMWASFAAEAPRTTNDPIVLTHQLPQWAREWRPITSNKLQTVADDEMRRHSGDPTFWDGIVISEKRFSESGFDWHLIRYSSIARPYNVIWFVPHDDENAAFEAMIAGIKQHGGVGIAVNSGPGSLRRQAGNGQCGGRPAIVTSCDPNRNFSAETPLFTSAILDHRTEHWQPVIALHTNGAGASGDFSLLDIDAYARGQVSLRKGAYAAQNPQAQMANYDTLGLIAYAARNKKPDIKAVACRTKLNKAGIHFWHERVDKSDGSLSNYLALDRPDIAYFNAESREESDLAVAATRHKIMIDAYLAGCINQKGK